MRARHLVTLLVVGGGPSALFGSSCKEPTAIRVEARTNAPPSSVKSTTFWIHTPSEADDAPVQAETPTVDPTGMIGSLVVVPKSKHDAPVAVRIVVGLSRRASECTKADGYAGCIVARRRLTYVPGLTLTLPILLEQSCIGVACDAETTCSNGGCVNAEVQCDGSSCGEPGGISSSDGGDAQSRLDAPADVANVDATDAADAPDARPDYRGITCVDQTCRLPSVCCLGKPGAGQCIAFDGPCAGTPAEPPFRLECDGPEDCPTVAAPYCCVVAEGFACRATCKADLVVCHANSDCVIKSLRCTPTTTPTGYAQCQ